MFLNCSTCFGRHKAHQQELKNCNCSLWFYIRLWLPVAAMAQPSTTRLRLVGSFYEIYITMHGSMNIKFKRDLGITVLFKLLSNQRDFATNMLLVYTVHCFICTSYIQVRISHKISHWIVTTDPSNNSLDQYFLQDTFHSNDSSQFLHITIYIIILKATLNSSPNIITVTK
jgi:hypothetical protein